MEDKTQQETPQQKKRGPKPKASGPRVPKLGDSVLFVTSSNTIRPAVVTYVGTEAVDLTVFNSEGAVPFNGAEQDLSDKRPLTYHFPSN